LLGTLLSPILSICLNHPSFLSDQTLLPTHFLGFCICPYFPLPPLRLFSHISFSLFFFLMYLKLFHFLSSGTMSR
jgi:hypothetical protein